MVRNFILSHFDPRGEDFPPARQLNFTLETRREKKLITFFRPTIWRVIIPFGPEAIIVSLGLIKAI
jgi:hypothetical protein